MTEGPEELEFLKRGEIRTMQKDVTKLREIESQKERKRIAVLKPEEMKKERIPILSEIKKEVSPLGGPPQPQSKKLFPSKKILIRAILLIIVLFVIGFSLWFGIRKPQEEVLPPSGEEVIPSEEEETVEKPEIIISPPLIPVSQTKTPEILGKEEILNVFNQILTEELPEGTFTRIAIKNISENRLVSLEDLVQVFQIDAPEEIFQKLEKDYTLSIYSQKEGKRVVFIGEIKEKEGLLDVLKNWEGKIEKSGLTVSGRKVSTMAVSFKTSFYQDVGFRYLTISRTDLGICYAWLDNYFVFTTSFESLKKTIEELKKPRVSEEIGQLFIVGFEGKTLNSDLEEFFKKYKPGGVLLLSKNIENKEQLKNLISDLQNLSQRETGLPLFIAVDQEGVISRIGFLEEKTAQSKIESPEAAYQIGLKKGNELKELGVNINLAPVLDFASEGDFLFNRSFQKNPEVAGELAKSLISGQKEAGILTAIKHFPGHGGISSNPEEKLATLESTPEISQFKKAMEVNPEMVMTSNVIYTKIDPSVPFTFSTKGIQFLKNNLSQEVLVISDDLDQNSLINKFSLKEIFKLPIESGVDILIFSGYRLPVEQGLNEFLTAVINGEISNEAINKAIVRVIKFKQDILK